MSSPVSFDETVRRTINSVKALISCAECGLRHPELDLAELRMRWLELSAPNHPAVAASLEAMRAELSRVRIFAQREVPAPDADTPRGPITEREARDFLARLEQGVPFPD